MHTTTIRARRSSPINAVDITRLAPGWQVADAYAAVWNELAAPWSRPPEPRPPFRVMGRLEHPAEDEEALLSLMAIQLLDPTRRSLDSQLKPDLDAVCLACGARFAPGIWPAADFPDRSALAAWQTSRDHYVTCPKCGHERLFVLSLQEAERRVEDAGRVREALARLGMDAAAFALAHDLVHAGHGAVIVALASPSCVWFGSARFGLGREEEWLAVEEPGLAGPAPVDRIIIEPAIHFGTDAYEGQDPAFD